MSLAKSLLKTPAVGDALYVDDVFSTYVYEGNGTSKDIVNGIDLENEGGMAWVKNRDQADTHVIVDTLRGAGETLTSETSSAEVTNADTVTAFSDDGFSLGTDVLVNTSSENYVSWTFRKAPKFFDVVTYTGNGVAGHEIAHDLGIAPGMMVVKRVSGSQAWRVYHRTLGGTKSLDLDKVDDALTVITLWNNTDPTDSVFTVGTDGSVNDGSSTYVAYLFAHDTADDGMIQCGSFTGNGLVDGPEIDLGWEPQYLLMKLSSGASNWYIIDALRGMVVGGDDALLNTNQSNAENAAAFLSPTPTGFKINTSSGAINPSGGTTVYMAIRRPNKPPESADEVFAIDTRTPLESPAFASQFPVDFAIVAYHTLALGKYCSSRLMQGYTLKTDTDASQSLNSAYMFDYMDGWQSPTSSSDTVISWMFRRAPGFFDVVCYEGDGVAGREVPHNLSVAPEMMWVKSRNSPRDWEVYHSVLTATNRIRLSYSGGGSADSSIWNDTEPVLDLFTVGTDVDVNTAGVDYIAYLFATLDGISKVGSYTGNGSSQTIDCGFAAGARFILIKRTDDTGDWYLWDTLRGIVSGDDPHLSLNTTDAQVTTDDSVDPDTSGFIVNQNTATNINVSAGEYIFYAIA